MTVVIKFSNFRCCQVHDECYGRIMKDPDLCTFSSSVYWKIYSRDDTCTGCGKSR